MLTGAASGLGRTTALAMAAEGAEVVGVDIDGKGLEATIAERPDRISGVEADITRRDACHGAVAEVIERHGRLDILGNIAGIARSEHVTDVTEDQWNLMLGVNVSGVYWCAQAALPHLLETDGTIINIASNAGLMGQAYTVAYCATKGAVVNMTRALAMEYVKTGIRVNAIAPGGIDTPLVHNYSMPDDVDFTLVQPYVGMRGMADPADIAEVFTFLASDAARGMHGAIVSVDAGVTAG